MEGLGSAAAILDPVVVAPDSLSSSLEDNLRCTLNDLSTGDMTVGTCGDLYSGNTEEVSEELDAVRHFASMEDVDPCLVSTEDDDLVSKDEVVDPDLVSRDEVDETERVLEGD